MSVAARIACFQLLPLGGIGVAVPAEIDYSVLSRYTSTPRQRGSQSWGSGRKTLAASIARTSDEVATTRITTSNARARATEG